MLQLPVRVRFRLFWRGMLEPVNSPRSLPDVVHRSWRGAREQLPSCAHGTRRFPLPQGGAAIGPKSNDLARGIAVRCWSNFIAKERHTSADSNRIPASCSPAHSHLPQRHRRPGNRRSPAIVAAPNQPGCSPKVQYRPCGECRYRFNMAAWARIGMRNNPHAGGRFVHTMYMSFGIAKKEQSHVR